MATTARNINEARRARIEDALDILEDAAKDTKEEFKDVLQHGYHHVKSTLRQMWVNRDDFGDAAENVQERARRIWKGSQKAIRQSAERIDDSIHDNPWAYVASSAALGFIAGFLMNNRKL